MFFIRLIRYLRGYVEFKCSGGFVERFLNLCNVNQLKLWDVKKRNGVLYATTDIKSYKQMHKSARKSGSVVRIVHKKGLPFLFANHRNRVGLLIGLAVFIIMLLVLTSFIWLVEIEGNESVEDAVLLEYFEEQGLKKGARLNSLTLSQLENDALADFPELAWVSINTYGCRVVVELRETVEAPEQVNKNQPANVKAAYDGTIVSMKVYEGFAELKVGDSVVAGDLIVSGVSESAVTGSTFYKRANASVTAETERVLEQEVTDQKEEKTYTDQEKKRNYLNFFTLKIPLYIGREPEGEYDLVSEDVPLVIWGTELPISFHRRVYRAYTVTYTQRSEEEMKADALALVEAQAEEEFPEGLEVVERKVTYDVSDGKCVARAVYTCHEEIAEQEDILIDAAE